MSQPAITLLRALAHMEATGATIRFVPYVLDSGDGKVTWPREGYSLRFSDRPQGENVLSPATLSKALKDGYLVRDWKQTDTFADGRPIYDSHVDARMTPAGAGLLSEHRWRLSRNEALPYAVLKPYQFATRDKSPGPLLKVTKVTPTRLYVDPVWRIEGEENTRHIHQIKGSGDKSYVEVDEVLGTMPDPVSYAELKEAYSNLLKEIEKTYLDEQEEIEERAKDIREKWAEKRKSISEKWSIRKAQAELAMTPLRQPGK